LAQAVSAQAGYISTWQVGYLVLVGISRCFVKNTYVHSLKSMPAREIPEQCNQPDASEGTVHPFALSEAT